MELATESKRAFRGVLSRPWFTAATLAALGLGIGLNTAIFSLVHAVLSSVLFEVSPSDPFTLAWWASCSGRRPPRRAPFPSEERRACTR